MPRPEKDSCDFFFTSTKLLYDTKIKALRRSFKPSGDANNAFFVFDYLFREIFGNEGYYIRYTDDLLGDTADFCYLDESFVKEVIQKCLDIELFHKGQFEENGILTSRAIQKKYESITARRTKQTIEGRFCVLDEELMSTKTELMCAETELMSTESTHSKRIESKRIEKKKKCLSFSIPFEDDSPTMMVVFATITDEALREALRNFIKSRYIAHDSIDEIRIGLLLKKMTTLSTDVKKQIELVENATAKGWKDFYPLPSDTSKQSKTARQSTTSLMGVTDPEEAKKIFFGTNNPPTQ